MCTIPPGAMEALTCLPPHSVVVQGKARSAAHWLWNPGCWFYLHPSWGHSCTLMWLQKLDPILSMGNYVMRPEHNSEPKYRIIMLTREEKTRRPGNPPAVKGPIWYREGSRMLGGEAVICRQSLGRTLSISLPTYAIVFQAYIYIYIYIYTILVCT